MPNFKIIGTDLKEYGPVSAEQIRQWITERRVDSDTKLQAEGDSEWRRLVDVPELAAGLSRTGPPTCPNCGEPFEDGFDSCWKCGTGADGSPPKHKIQVEADAKGVAGQCPRCQGQRVVVGRLIASRGPVVFRPGKLRNFTFTLLGGVEASVAQSWGCLDCGFLWGQIDHAKLEAFIRRHCTEETRKECGLSD
jgi:DNA-directed RNA polymerase subunit RPC12/RpoP